MTNALGWTRAAHLGKPRVPSEAEEQRTLAQWLDLSGVLWCHVPNGGQRDRRVAAQLTGQGVKRGVPDILIFTPPMTFDPWPAVGASMDVITSSCEQPPLTWRNPMELDDAKHRIYTFTSARGVAIELKRRGATASDISKEQIVWGGHLAQRGWYWFVARGAQEAMDELTRIGLAPGKSFR